MKVSSDGKYLRQIQKIKNEYLFHCLSWNSFFLHSMNRFATGSTYPTITSDDVENFEIPLPKVLEQENYVKNLIISIIKY